jgi:hypothetical protein
MASRTHATRCRVRLAARTWVESVHWGPPALIQPRAIQAGQEGIEEPLAGLMGEQATATIVHQREVKSWVGQLEAQGILPIHTAADRIRRLAIGEPFDLEKTSMSLAPMRDESLLPDIDAAVLQVPMCRPILRHDHGPYRGPA